tara:strand:+ start:185 stop:598 length:414 start_codon:yes stop_codon:yes gene_type:complete
MQKAVIVRLNADEKQTLGRLYLFDGLDNVFNCTTLELPFKANLRNISCIPPGQYEVVKRFSKNYGEHYIIKNVPDRTYILIHVANYYTDLRGCIGVGKTFANINEDYFIDITNSRNSLKALIDHAPEGFSLTIIDAV